MLDGFTFERFYECPTDWKSHAEWLKRQTPEHLGLASTDGASHRSAFRPQPWAQTIKVLRDMGNDRTPLHGP